MTTPVDIVNRALNAIGSLNRIGSLTEDTTEAKVANGIYENIRDELLRKAPWDCGLKFANLIYITSVPGTPENTSPATNNWQPGQPAPPWAYEYWYPDDCLLACYVIPAQQTGFADGVPITTAVTGGAPAFWQGQPIKFKVSTDQFRSASGLAVTAVGVGYQAGDTAIFGVQTLSNNFNAQAVPAGIVQVVVDTVDGSGGITGATLQAFSTVQQNALLFSVPTYTLRQVSTTGLGSGATITVSGVSQTQFDNRVILTNQEYASFAYIKQVTDPNVMDRLFQDAWVQIIGAEIAMGLSGDKDRANRCIVKANEAIAQARRQDGNEGLTMNDVTPDFIRIRGIAWSEYYTGPWAQYDWGSFWPVY